MFLRIFYRNNIFELLSPVHKDKGCPFHIPTTSFKARATSMQTFFFMEFQIGTSYWATLRILRTIISLSLLLVTFFLRIKNALNFFYLLLKYMNLCQFKCILYHIFYGVLDTNYSLIYSDVMLIFCANSR